MRRSLADIIKAAEEDARQEKLAAQRPQPTTKPQEKTASDQFDPSDPKVAKALAKLAQELAQQMKQAEETAITGDTMTSAPAQSPEQTDAPAGKTPDLSPGGNIFTSKDTSETPPKESLTPGAEQAEQAMTLEGKSAALNRAVAAVHRRYTDAARALGLAKSAEQPLGGVEGTTPDVGKAPESTPDAPSAVGSPTPPQTPEAVANFTAQQADTQHEADMPVSSSALSAAHDDPPMDHVESGLKAAAVRAMLTTLDPGSKLAQSIKHRLAAMAKKAEDPLPAKVAPPADVNISPAEGMTVTPAPRPIVPPGGLDPRLYGTGSFVPGGPGGGLDTQYPVE